MKLSIKYLLLAFFSLFAPILGLLISVAVAIILDTILGIYKSIKLKIPITSRKLSNVISKLVLYQVALLSVYGIDRLLLDEFMKLHFQIEYIPTKIVALILIFVEVTSIKENFEEAFEINIFKKLKFFLKRTKEIKNDIEEIM